jgi:hypothetical protein
LDVERLQSLRRALTLKAVIIEALEQAVAEKPKPAKKRSR